MSEFDFDFCVDFEKRVWMLSW